METLTSPMDANTVLKKWDLKPLRKVRYEATQQTILAPTHGLIQRSYTFNNQDQPGLMIRRSKNLPFSGVPSEYIWLKAYTTEGELLDIGVDSAYVFSQTSVYLTAKMIHQTAGHNQFFFNLVKMAVYEFSGLLKLSIEAFLSPEEIQKKKPKDYLSLDYKKSSAAIVVSTTHVLDGLELAAKNYCMQYWQDYKAMGQLLSFGFDVYLYPRKIFWTTGEVYALDLGDLFPVQTLAGDGSIRGAIKFQDPRYGFRKYEVFFKMNEEDTKLHFGKDDFEQGVSDTPAHIAPHEEIELEIRAGKTTLLFNDLCSIQAGTLIELRDHALPFVTLCVMGSPLFEGELVHFQDQIMVQITKRLD